MKLAAAIQIRPLPHWLWHFYNGVLSFALGIFIVCRCPIAEKFGVTATVGIVGLGFTLAGESALFASLLRFWPLALIALGVLVLFGGLLSSGRQRPSGAAPGNLHFERFW